MARPLVAFQDRGAATHPPLLPAGLAKGSHPWAIFDLIPDNGFLASWARDELGCLYPPSASSRSCPPRFLGHSRAAWKGILVDLEYPRYNTIQVQYLFVPRYFVPRAALIRGRRGKNSLHLAALAHNSILPVQRTTRRPVSPVLAANCRPPIRAGSFHVAIRTLGVSVSIFLSPFRFRGYGSEGKNGKWGMQKEGTSHLEFWEVLPLFQSVQSRPRAVPIGKTLSRRDCPTNPATCCPLPRLQAHHHRP